MPEMVSSIFKLGTGWSAHTNSCEEERKCPDAGNGDEKRYAAQTVVEDNVTKQVASHCECEDATADIARVEEPRLSPARRSEGKDAVVCEPL